MYVSRIGLTVLKGARHRSQPAVQLSVAGAAHDRLFCLVDRAGGRVVRTFETPRVLRVEALWDGEVLTIRTPHGQEVAAPARPSGEQLECEYWGRRARLDIIDSAHAELLSHHLRQPVHLARVTEPGAVIYAGPISLISSGELARLGPDIDPARFRATFTLDADGLPAPGTSLHLGEATIRIRGSLPRCRVIDINPTTGAPDRALLETLAASPHPRGELPFGVDADVLTPGVVRQGDPVTQTRGR